MFGALAGLAIGTAAKAGLDYLKGVNSNKHYADRLRDQAQLQYRYAQMYAQNSPSWNVAGLRAAGLNPILAVSNGVNLGASVPSLTAPNPDTDSGTAPDLVGAYQGSQRLSLDKVNAESNQMSAQASADNAYSNMIKAEADARLKDAQTLEVLQRTKFDGQGEGYKNEILNDVSRGLNKLSDAHANGTTTTEPFLRHSPSDDFKPRYPDSTFFGSIQNSIDEKNWLSKETGKSFGELSRMSDTEYNTLLHKVRDSKRPTNKSKGMHVFTR